MLGTVWFDIAYSEHFVIVKNETEYSDDLQCWSCLVLDGERPGRLCEVYGFELKHNRFKKVG